MVSILLVKRVENEGGLPPRGCWVGPRRCGSGQASRSRGAMPTTGVTHVVATVAR